MVDSPGLPGSILIYIYFIDVIINDPSFNYQKYTNVWKIYMATKDSKTKQ